MMNFNKKTAALAGLLLLTGTLTASAQEEKPREKSIYLELLGPSNGIGVSYDARLKKGSPFGFRAGFGFGYSQSNWFFGDTQSTRVYSFPLEANYLAGKKKSKLELGLGVNLGLYNDHHRVGYYEPVSGLPDTYQEKVYSSSENNFSSFAYFNVGYRHTATKGFQFRIGLTTAATLGNARQSAHSVMLAPYISFGKAF
ncbi:hypothetical protein [Prevotella dentasini]|uniref:hypothetical protein n=1 Tax=Prevotella dentasini TaxID=589537 RepID=UPI00046A975B|nr:hypothetical protein [Prevotella dentasini]